MLSASVYWWQDREFGARVDEIVISQDCLLIGDCRNRQQPCCRLVATLLRKLREGVPYITHASAIS